MSRKLDLRTGTPVWQAYRTLVTRTEKLSRDVKADVLVVGMGISGAMIAESITAEGNSVIAIDRRGPLKGSTAATTALVQYEIDQPLSLLSHAIGKDRAQRAWRRSRLAIANLKNRIERLGLICEMEERPSLYLAGNILGPTGLRDEAAARRSIGIDTTYLARGELKEQFGFDRQGALMSGGNLALDPRKLGAGLLAAAALRGARFYSPVEAMQFKTRGERIEVKTGGGHLIDAGAVVLATGYELAGIVPSTGHRVLSTWAMATKPQPSALWFDAAMIWEASSPYLYVRTTADGRVVCGGEDEEFVDEQARDELIQRKSKAIARKLHKLLPWLDVEPEFAWTGSFGSTATGLPIIRRLPRRGAIYAVMGYGGNGITFSQIASEIIRSALIGQPDRDAGLFR